MDESILDSVKKSIGLQPDYTEFDSDLILLINGNLMTLVQNGVGKEGFRISGRSEIWSDFFGDYTDVELAKTFIYLKTRVIFDPPTTSAVLDAYNKEADECLWRCLIEVEDVRDQQSDEPSPEPPASGDYYEGTYVVVPKVRPQTMETEGLYMKDDVNITEIPIEQVSNPSNGKTVVIG